VFNKIRKYLLPVIMFFLFEMIAVILWLSINKIFYLFNFSYIGFFVSLGIVLMTAVICLAALKYLQLFI
jgi:hypothetical protein